MLSIISQKQVRSEGEKTMYYAESIHPAIVSQQALTKHKKF